MKKKDCIHITKDWGCSIKKGVGWRQEWCGAYFFSDRCEHQVKKTLTKKM